MITIRDGNILEADKEALVNTVNTAGVMGKGIALQFRQAFPENYNIYIRACKYGEVKPGKMLLVETGRFSNPKYIINFPTKRHWRGKARIEDIELGLKDLVKIINEKCIRSIAIPPLGCGFGGLDWNEVRPLIISAVEPLKDVSILIFNPHGAPAPEKMRVATNRPRMTIGRAALIELIDRYGISGYSLTQLEIQKLAYFLQVVGEPLKLNYVKQQYGPYAENLHFVLQHLEGHYLRGYGDRSGRSYIHLIPGAKEEAQQFLSEHPETLDHLWRVFNLIEGFETPYGMELLATVHWLAQENNSVKSDPCAAIQGFKSWNQRKRENFHPEHIKIAWNRLHQQNWL